MVDNSWYERGKMFDGGNKNSPINLQQKICIVDIMNSNCILTLKMTKMTYLSICDIATLDKLFITFMFTNNTIAKRRVVWEPLYRACVPSQVNLYQDHFNQIGRASCRERV